MLWQLTILPSILLLILSFPMCFAREGMLAAHYAMHTTELQGNFHETVQAGKTVVITYKAQCGHCRRFLRELSLMMPQLPGNIKITTINLGIHASLLPVLNVRGHLPIILFFKDGKEVGRTGYENKEQFIMAVRRYLG